MIFWDSSALLPLLILEEKTASLLDLRETSEEIVAWTLTPVEVASALSRLQRTAKVTDTQLTAALKVWASIEEGLTLIRDVDAAKQRALRLIRNHPLKAADALQLAAALIACSDVTSDHIFVTLDLRLQAAAAKEGFQVQLTCS